MKKLLDRTFRPMALYALVVLVLSIPAYFFLINYIWISELDKHHTAMRNKIEVKMNELDLKESALSVAISTWDQVQPGSTLIPLPANATIKDSFYTSNRYDKFHGELERFRGLSTSLKINGAPYQLIIETNVEEVDETIMFIAGVTSVFILLLLGGFVLLNRQLSKRVWRPFYSTIDKLQQFDLDGDKTIELGHTRIIEFSALNETAQKLTERNTKVYRQQKEFTENASHELQTPLALLTSRIDLLLQDASFTEEQLEKIASLNIPLAKMSRINKNLLLLARIGNHRFSAEETVNMSLLVEECLDLLEGHLAFKQITVKKNIDEQVLLKANNSLAEILVTNLLLNAIRHNSDNGNILITLTGTAFTIANSGEQALNEATLFRRFANVNPGTPSTGLGLAIVKEIADKHQWKVSYRFAGQQHVFEIIF
ncbi:MAG TPA: HAMP domain-containing sensor histidine kinase [Chitinophagaceae bacterium]